MRETGAHRDTRSLDWSDVLGASESLPTGTVTLLLADVEGSTRLWEAEPEAVTAAVARLDGVIEGTVARHGGVRPLEQGEGDSFVVAFARAADAVACALELQRAPLAPIRLRIGLHSGDVQLRDEHNYMGPTVNRAARLRDLGHGGQTLLSGATADLVDDRLPDGAWLTDLGSHRLRDLSRPERVVQLCHPEVRVEFPALRSQDAFKHNLPVQLTRFIGRRDEMAQIAALLAQDRLVTLTGAGGSGKTRLALEIAGEMLSEFAAGVWLVDLAPVTDPDVVPVAVSRALGVRDEMGRSTMETVVSFIADRQMLVLLDNCEHLLDACARLIEELLRACPALTILATSREPIGVPGEATWRVPSLTLTDEAIELFADRAQRTRDGFELGEHADAVAEICARLDGIPLAIELAAARVRAFTPAEIVAGLHDRFRLLTGGARTAVRRQQTLRASVDWSHALLTEPERALFRRLAAFAGTFDLDAARAVGGGAGLEEHQVLDQLALLVDKSLVAVDNAQLITRYRLLETVRQYALEKLGESGEADLVRTRHRDHYTALAGRLDVPGIGAHRDQLETIERDMDNLRAAFHWSRELSDTAAALRVASSLQPLWLSRAHMREGLTWLNPALDDANDQPDAVPAATRARALADAAVLEAWSGVGPNPRSEQRSDEAVALARHLDDQSLLVRALTAAGCTAGYLADVGQPYFEEAIVLARAANDTWTLLQILGWQTFTAFVSGDPTAVLMIGQEGLVVADDIGNDFFSRQCRTWIGFALAWQGDLARSRAMLEELIAEAETARNPMWQLFGLAALGLTLAYLGEIDDARAAGHASVTVSTDLGPVFEVSGFQTLATVAAASGDRAALHDASNAALHRMNLPHLAATCYAYVAEADLANNDLAAAREHADTAVASAAKLNMQQPAMNALLIRARVASALGDLDQARDDAHHALQIANNIEARIGIADILECLAGLATRTTNYQDAARFIGAADAIRHHAGAVRFALYQPDYDNVVNATRTAIGDTAFQQATAQGAALTIAEAVTYALRGRGERKRPASGWASLTPTEREVVRLVGEGLTNKDIATRLFISPRTVQSHLTHIYTKLDITSRVQLANEAARHL